MTPSPCRSVLFVPASNPRAIAKARGLNCDVVILDLEDAVAPDAKDAAREAACEALREGGFRPKVGVRINPHDSDWGEADTRALAEVEPKLIVLPKVERATQIKAVSRAMGGHTSLWAMIETPRALFNLEEIAQCEAPIDALMPGVNDLAVALGATLGPDREPIKSWLAMIVAAARVSNNLAIDGVYNSIDNLDGFATECAQGAAFGFDGKSLIHPSQIDTANAAFAPDAAAVAHAREIVEAFSSPDAEALGVVRIDDRMVERLHLEQAKRLLARHDALVEAQSRE
ncbi:CoA ester lyase [Brevundimonas sp. A19_0]|uniref:HpcH/HpaI aldolase/citrate lyase family protein n=1 Tax=Brevundimonas sp. A19_0 TaxID=2821087 RepID=UPI001ADBED8D|nr:CoA ester lyase [Brevundimonas sp. A19_0]MBO9501139.1 CoA ester lyase [Brevundimonas sp. A19_0]